jgi:hypothetical protein
MDRKKEKTDVITKTFIQSLKEVRATDKDLVIAPKGISHKVWEAANSIAMMIRIVHPVNGIAAVPTLMEILLDDTILPREHLYECFPDGADQLHKQLKSLTGSLAGSGFGKILWCTARVLLLNQTKK